MRRTVAIRRGALLAAAAMAGAALGPQTQAFDLVALARDAVPRVLVSSAYPFDPWSTPVHYPTPQDLSQPLAPPPPPPPPTGVPTTPGSPVGTGTLPGSDLGIPVNVLAAYIATADKMAGTAPGCGLTWEMLAGVGRVESHHAAGGNLGADGTTVTPIIGPALDGSGGIARIADSDGGRYDGDRQWDHAVGPMQFLPGTWRAWGVDGNADGVADPNNIYDSTLAAAHYLCAGGRNLGVEANLRAALYAYNPSYSYVDTVLAWIRAYQRSGGIPVLPVPISPNPPAHTPPSGTSGPTPSPTQTMSNPPVDHQAPTTPKRLRVTGHSSTSVSLAWSASTDNVGVTGYQVFLGKRLVATVSGTRLTVNGLSEGSHTFTVRARDAAGNRSANSAPVTVVNDHTPPSVPTGLQIDSANRSSAVVSWSASSDNLDDSVDYLVFVRRVDGSIASGVTAAVTGTTATIDGLTPGVSYTVEVFATDRSGNTSTPAAAATLPPDREKPSKPTGLTAVAQPPNPDDPAPAWAVDLGWLASTDDVGVAEYDVSYAIVNADGSVGTSTPASPLPAEDCATNADQTVCTTTVSGLEAGVQYEFTVIAKDGAEKVSAAAKVRVGTEQAGGSSPSPTSSPSSTPTSSTSPSTSGSPTASPSGSTSSSSSPASSSSAEQTTSAPSATDPSTSSAEPAPSPTESSSTPTDGSTTAPTETSTGGSTEQTTSESSPTASPSEPATSDSTDSATP